MSRQLFPYALRVVRPKIVPMLITCVLERQARPFPIAPLDILALLMAFGTAAVQRKVSYYIFFPTV